MTLQSLRANHTNTLGKISTFNQTGDLSGIDSRINDLTDQLENLDADDDLPDIGDSEIGGKVKISLADMDLPSWEHELKVDLEIIDALLTSMNKITAADDAKLQHLKTLVLEKIAAPLNPGNKKVLIFTAFADTADYLYANWLRNCWLHRPCTVQKSPAKGDRRARSRRAMTSRNCSPSSRRTRRRKPSCCQMRRQR